MVCMAYVRCEFKKAQAVGKDIRVDYFICEIGRLYRIEMEYKILHRKSDEISKIWKMRA